MRFFLTMMVLLILMAVPARAQPPPELRLEEKEIDRLLEDLAKDLPQSHLRYLREVANEADDVVTLDEAMQQIQESAILAASYELFAVLSQLRLTDEPETLAVPPPLPPPVEETNWAGIILLSAIVLMLVIGVAGLVCWRVAAPQ